LIVSNVGIGNFGVLSSSGDDVLVSIIRPSSVASLIDGITINDLLGSQNGEVSVCNSPGGFDGFSCRESPAGSTLFLVLDGGDDTGFVVPIEGGRDGSRRDGINNRGVG